MEQLFQIVSCNLPENMWTNLFNTPTQLMSFLRLFSDSFHIQANLVSLLQPPKINQEHINTQVLLMKESNEELKKKQLNLAGNNINNSINETVSKEPTPSPPTEKKVVKSSPKSISDRLIKPPIKKSISITEGTKIEPQLKSLSPEPIVIPQNQHSNGDVLRKPVEVRKSESPKKSLSPEPPLSVNTLQSNFASSPDDRNRGLSFRLGEFDSKIHTKLRNKYLNPVS